MKQAFIDTLTNLMCNHEDVVVVTADMGFSVFEGIQKRFPKRFFNTGITEQATTSFVAGLALFGYKVYFYAQAPFITMRCFEQVRLDIAYNLLDVKLIGSNSGFSLNQYGVSHFGLEDIALMKTLPNMTIFTPADSVEMNKVIDETYTITEPTYVRMTKTGNTTIHTTKTFDIRSPVLIVDGQDGLLLVSGGLLERATHIVQKLKEQDINIALYSCPLIKPINEKLIVSLISKFKHIFTLEEHSVIGGFGSTLANILVDNNINVQLVKFALPDKYLHISGSIDHLLDKSGLGIDTITQKITQLISTK